MAARVALLHPTLSRRVLAFHTGMRPGEIAGRRWRDLDENAKPLGALSVHPSPPSP